MTETRAFPLADAISITSSILLSRRCMRGVSELVDWMAEGTPTPRWLDRDEATRLLRRCAQCRTALLAQHPWLADLTPPNGADIAELYAWLVEAERTHGEHIEVSRLVPFADQLAAISRAMTSTLQNWHDANMPVFFRTMQEMGDRIRELAEAFNAGVTQALADHPDVAELDVQLESFYGEGSHGR